MSCTRCDTLQTVWTFRFALRARLIAWGSLGLFIAAAEALPSQQPLPQHPTDARTAAQPGEPQNHGMATGTARGAQFDDKHRPITAGGTVKTGPIVFQDVAAQAGLTSWRNTTGTPQKHLIIEAKGSGVCLLDFDHDGWLDIYLVNGSTFEALAGKGCAAACRVVPEQS